jgi:proteasome lid subunit RPN8/RPN11
MAHAQSESPNECCGLLAGSGEWITESYPILNLPSDDPRLKDFDVPADRKVRYLMDPVEQFSAIRKMRNAGLMFMGIYHSHPHSQAYPSMTDVRLAFYPNLFYLIISLEKAQPALAAFSIVDQKIIEEEIVIV